MNAQAAAGLSCNACMVAFPTLAALKDHYRRDFHRYNLKRKVAGLGPISDETFHKRKQAVLAAKRGAASDKAAHDSSYKCMACHKIFSSRPPYVQHLASKKHKAQLKKLEEKKRAAAAQKKKEKKKIEEERKRDLADKGRDLIRTGLTPTSSPAAGPLSAAEDIEPMSIAATAATKAA